MNHPEMYGKLLLFTLLVLFGFWVFCSASTTGRMGNICYSYDPLAAGLLF